MKQEATVYLFIAYSKLVLLANFYIFINKVLTRHVNFLDNLKLRKHTEFQN